LKLEETRGDHHFGDVGYRLEQGDAPKPFLFHGYATTAVALTMQGLDQFQTIRSLGANPYVTPGVLFWFHTAESLISTVLKILNDYAARGGESPLTESRKVSDKLTAVQTRMEVDQGEAKRLVNRFTDFTTVRNRLSHDLTTDRQAPLLHTAFAGEVGQANEVDLLEACAISVSICAHLRAAFAGADLMPSVSIADRFVKADVVAEEVLFPAFDRIVELKGLETDFAPSIDRVPLGTQLLVPFEALISADGPRAPLDSSETPSAVQDFVTDLIESRPLTPDKFQLPNYARPE
jgi:hypothetical protein